MTVSVFIVKSAAHYTIRVLGEPVYPLDTSLGYCARVQLLF